MHPYQRERSALVRTVIGNGVMVAALPILAWLLSGWTGRIVALAIALVAWTILSYVSVAKYRRIVGNPVRMDKHLRNL